MLAITCQTGMPCFAALHALFQAFDFRVTFKSCNRRRLTPDDLHSLTVRFSLLHSFKVFYSSLKHTLNFVLCQLQTTLCA